MKEYRQTNGPAVLLDAGNFSSAKGRQQQLLSDYFMRGMKQLNYTAVLVGDLELRRGLALLLEANKTAQLPLLSSNLIDASGKPLFQEIVTARYKSLNLAIIGLTDNVQIAAGDTGRYTVEEPEAAAVRLAGKIRKERNTLIILLSNLREDKLKRILDKTDFIDLVILADQPQFRESPTAVGRALVVSDPRETRAIQGLSFHFKEGKIADASGSSVSLEPKYDKNKGIDDLFKQYDEALKKIKFAWPRPKDAQKIYAGSASCAPCHRKEAELEKLAPHVRAIEVLEKVGSQYNPACLECHVTGLEKENGFWDLESSRDMAGVQCEQCHGPQQNHVQEENKLPFGQPDFGGGGGAAKERQFKPYKAGFYLCSRCHEGEWKLDEPPEEAWKKVGHSSK